MTPTQRSAEARILFRLAGAGGLGASERAILDTVRWDRLVAIALLENATTTLARQVSVLPPELVPAEAAARVRKLARVWEFKLGVLHARLGEALALLHGAGIDVALLKGAALAVTAYASFAERGMGDVDLLIDPARGRQAHELLQAAGWSWDRDRFPDGAYGAHHHLPPLADTRGSGLRLELHTAPLPAGHRYRLSSADLLAGARMVHVAGVPVRVPEPHLHVVHAAAHLAWSHLMESGAWNTLRDVATLATSRMLDWGRLVEVARGTGTMHSTYWTLRLARTLVGLPVPDEILGALEPRVSRPMLAALERHFVHLVLRDDFACPSVSLKRRLWRVALGREAVAALPTPFEPAEGGAEEELSSTAVRRAVRHLAHVPRWARFLSSVFFTASAAI